MTHTLGLRKLKKPGDPPGGQKSHETVTPARKNAHGHSLQKTAGKKKNRQLAVNNVLLEGRKQQGGKGGKQDGSCGTGDYQEVGGRKQN